MKNSLNRFYVLMLITFLTSALVAQQKEADPHDFGKMWTFENPPVEWFQEAYDFEPGQEWFDHVRKSSLRFASWCSGSFVSPEGLIMTNHHCSRGVSLQVQREGEDFTENGFYAVSSDKERRVPGLFVEQLIQAVDITEAYESLLDEGKEKKEIEDEIKANYQAKKGWEDLRIQFVSYYSGAKHSIYGYKRYADIRLVLVPEVKVGFYGGEEDNFTYPRYNLDFTFWRAYDENGDPLNTSANYMAFNPNGPEEGEPVFVIGNPARTQRYKTYAQLEYDRDSRYPLMIDFVSTTYDQLQAKYEKDPSPSLMNRIFGLSNSLKVFRGVYKGLNNEELMSRKKAMEDKLRAETADQTPWIQMEELMKRAEAESWAMNLLGPNESKGSTFMLMHSLYKYEQQLKEGKTESELELTREEVMNWVEKAGSEEDKNDFLALLGQIEKYIPHDNSLLKDLKSGKSNEAYVDYLFDKSRFYKEKKAKKCLTAKSAKFLKQNDPLLTASRELISAYDQAATTFSENGPKIEAIQKQVAKNAFKVFGEQLPPDATFTLRISDGVVKGYEYNGTVAPFQTTFYGMYDRYYSNPGKESWSLPEKWKNPNNEMLRTPLNFVSTNDIIGGNSGSPIINRNKEVVGLIFDGNIESLPGNFIFDDEVNRAVSVHTSGMLAALRYVYQAERIVMELLDKK